MQGNLDILLLDVEKVPIIICCFAFRCPTGRSRRVRIGFTFATVASTRITLRTFITVLLFIYRKKNMFVTKYNSISRTQTVSLTVFFSFIITQLLPRMKEKIGNKMAQDLLDAPLLALLHSSLSLDVVHQQIGGVIQDCAIFIWQDKVRSEDGLAALFVLFVLLKRGNRTVRYCELRESCYLLHQTAFQFH